jgi:hypothetical protein
MLIRIWEGADRPRVRSPCPWSPYSTENPYPAAAEDMVDAVKFIYCDGKAEFNTK